MYRIIAFLLFVTSFCTVVAQNDVSGETSANDDRSKSYVHMLHTDVTRFNESINPDAWILVGNVQFRRDSMYMFCDSAHYYQKQNSFQAFGNVRMEQGDTLHMSGDYLDYDGNANLARMRGNVQLVDKKTTLETDSLDFDRNVNLGYFFEYGVLFDDEERNRNNWTGRAYDVQNIMEILREI